MGKATARPSKVVPRAGDVAPKRCAPARGTDADGEAYMGLVAELGCCLCRRMGYGETPAEVHHPRTGTGAGQRASNFDTIPLCTEHHRGQTGLHGMGRKAWERHYGVRELDFVSETRALVLKRHALKINARPLPAGIALSVTHE